MIHIPYSKFELTFALGTAGDILEPKQKELTEKVNAIAAEPENKMKAVAEFIGISLNDLINSPNMDKLIQQFDDYKRDQVMIILKELGLSDKEAWAVFVYIFNPHLLDLEH